MNKTLVASAIALAAGFAAQAVELTVEILTRNLTRVREVGTAGSGMNRYGILKEYKPTATSTAAEGDLALAGAKVKVEKVGEGYRIRFPLAADECVYGLGDVSRSNIQRRPGKYEIYVKNVNSYIPIPMTITSKGRGLFMNTTWRNEFDVGEGDKNAIVCTAKKSPIDFYVFTGKDYRKLLNVYTDLTGRPALLPVFGYGFAFVCNQWIDQFNLVREAQEFRDRDLPCDIVGLEPGWMETFYDTRTDKVWDPVRFYFPYWCPKSHHTFIAALGRMGFKLSLWLCCNYDLFRYEEVLLGGKIVEAPKKVGADGQDEDGTFHDGHIENAGAKIRDPRYSSARRIYPEKKVPEGHEPWFKHLEFFVDQGARCFKLDGSCQVTEWNGVPNRTWANGMDDEEAHNLYPLVYDKQMALGYENHTKKRAMVYSAGGYAGVQQYVATWAGDTGGGPKSLVSILNLAASGHSNQSCDMDIYMKNPEGDELPRIVNAKGLHFGFLQPWSQQNNWDYWEQPWYQPEEDFEIVKGYVKLRYLFLPYFYAAAAEAARTGWPMMRPLAFMHPDVAEYGELSTTYYLGDSLLVSCYTDTTTLPDGLWYDWWTGKALKGGREVKNNFTRAIGGGLYVKAGAIIPMLPAGVRHVDKGWSEKIEIHVWTGADGKGEWYEDDGDSLGYRTGAFATTPLTFKNDRLTIGPRTGSFAKMPETHDVTVVAHSDGNKLRTIALGEVSAATGRTVENLVGKAGDGSKVLHAKETHGTMVKPESLPLRCTARETVKGEAPSLLPDGRDFSLVWNDEFNGSQLDASKWGYRTNFWGQRFSAFAGPEDGCVEVKDGKAHLKLKQRADGQFCSPQLQTGELLWDYSWDENRKGFWPIGKREPPKFVHRYGYYESRFRLQRRPGWWSAFWMQSETQGVCLDPARAGIEHDIMESFAPGCVGRHMFHMNGYGADYKGFCTPRPVPGQTHTLNVSTDDFHTFGLLWEPDGYTVFVDGRQDGEKVGTGPGEAVSQTPEFILISTECQWYRQNRMTGTAVEELEESARLGDDFVVDYVRVYDLLK